MKHNNFKIKQKKQPWTQKKNKSEVRKKQHGH